MGANHHTLEGSTRSVGGNEATGGTFSLDHSGSIVLGGDLVYANDFEMK